MCDDIIALPDEAGGKETQEDVHELGADAGQPAGIAAANIAEVQPPAAADFTANSTWGHRHGIAAAPADAHQNGADMTHVPENSDHLTGSSRAETGAGQAAASDAGRAVVAGVLPADCAPHGVAEDADQAQEAIKGSETEIQPAADQHPELAGPAAAGTAAEGAQLRGQQQSQAAGPIVGLVPTPEVPDMLGAAAEHRSKTDETSVAAAAPTSAPAPAPAAEVTASGDAGDGCTGAAEGQGDAEEYLPLPVFEDKGPLDAGASDGPTQQQQQQPQAAAVSRQDPRHAAHGTAGASSDPRRSGEGARPSSRDPRLAGQQQQQPGEPGAAPAPAAGADAPSGDCPRQRAPGEKRRSRSRSRDGRRREDREAGDGEEAREAKRARRPPSPRSRGPGRRHISAGPGAVHPGARQRGWQEPGGAGGRRPYPPGQRWGDEPPHGPGQRWEPSDRLGRGAPPPGRQHRDFDPHSRRHEAGPPPPRSGFGQQGPGPQPGWGPGPEPTPAPRLPAGPRSPGRGPRPGGLSDAGRPQPREPGRFGPPLGMEGPQGGGGGGGRGGGFARPPHDGPLGYAPGSQQRPVPALGVQQRVDGPPRHGRGYGEGPAGPMGPGPLPGAMPPHQPRFAPGSVHTAMGPAPFQQEPPAIRPGMMPPPYAQQHQQQQFGGPPPLAAPPAPAEPFDPPGFPHGGPAPYQGQPAGMTGIINGPHFSHQQPEPFQQQRQPFGGPDGQQFGGPGPLYEPVPPMQRRGDGGSGGPPLELQHPAGYAGNGPAGPGHQQMPDAGPPSESRGVSRFRGGPGGWHDPQPPRQYAPRDAGGVYGGRGTPDLESQRPWGGREAPPSGHAGPPPRFDDRAAPPRGRGPLLSRGPAPFERPGTPDMLGPPLQGTAPHRDSGPPPRFDRNGAMPGPAIRGPFPRPGQGEPPMGAAHGPGAEQQQVWYYVDPKGLVQGPHSISQFRRWLDSLAQRPDLREDFLAFRSVSVFKQHGGAQVPLAALLG